MNRIFFIVVAAIVVIGVAVMIWVLPDTARSPASTVPAAAPAQQFNTTGGQEMQPRWDTSEEPGNDTAEN